MIILWQNGVHENILSISGFSINSLITMLRQFLKISRHINTRKINIKNPSGVSFLRYVRINWKRICV